ncbi:MAG: hypothetical protein A2231_02815 [Candidatus Firestonebacteria bacterium RIFOXYA2_FULL_40_8]|nr:MAG: hypothetical protein A2231_02815 [Candidatus Firestonebacteria bacterium RIFOXYA2_FULL_40_8]
MKKIIILLASVLVSVTMVFSEEIDSTKTWKAFKTDGIYNRAQLDSLGIQIELKKYFLSEIDKNPAPIATAEQRKAGYILFIRNYLFDVFPFNKPLKEEMAKKDIKIFASLGEYEPIVFSVYPLENLTVCRIIISEFNNEKGDKLTKESFQVNNVLAYPNEGGSMIGITNVLKRANDIPLIEKEVVKSVWINVKIPENAKEGVYKGTVTFAPTGKPSASIPVEIRVFPYRLMQPPPEVMTWAPIMAGSHDFDLEKEFTTIKELGMTGEITDLRDLNKANKYMEIAKKVGLPGKFVDFSLHCQGTSKYESTYGPYGMGDTQFCEASYQRLTEDVRKIQENATKNKWLPFLFYLTTECGYPGASGPESYRKTQQGCENYYAAARKVEGANLMATFNRQEELTAHWNLSTLDAFGFNGEMFPEWEKGMKQKPSWMTFIAIDQRCGHGFYMRKYDFKGVRPWKLYLDQLDGSGLMFWDKEKKEFLPVARFNRIREGVDDYKYCYTLSELIKEAKAKGKDVSGAEKVLKTILDKIPHDHKKHTAGFDYTKMDEFRLKLAEQILKIK